MTVLVPMSVGRSLAAYVSETRAEVVRILRAPEFFVPVVLMPIGFYLLIGVAMRELRSQAPSGGAQGDVAVFVSFAVYAALAVGMVNIGIQLAVDRSYRLLDLKRALPMPPMSYLLAKLIAGAGFALLTIALLTTLAATLGGVPLEPARLAALVGIMVLGIAPACAIGLFIAAYMSISAASATANILFIAMMSLGGLFYPLPGALKAMAPLWPAYHLHQLGLLAMGAPNHSEPLVNVGVLAGVTAVFGVLAARRLARAG